MAGRTITIGVSHAMTEGDIDEITHVAALYLKWEHLFTKGGALEGYRDKDGMGLMYQRGVVDLWPHVYDVAYKAGRRDGKRWAFPVLGFAGYGFGVMAVQVTLAIWHLFQ